MPRRGFAERSATRAERAYPYCRPTAHRRRSADSIGPLTFVVGHEISCWRMQHLARWMRSARERYPDAAPRGQTSSRRASNPLLD